MINAQHEEIREDLEPIFKQLEQTEMSGRNNPRGVRLSDLQLQLLAIAGRQMGISHSKFVSNCVDAEILRMLPSMNIPKETAGEFLQECLERNKF